MKKHLSFTRRSLSVGGFLLLLASHLAIAQTPAALGAEEAAVKAVIERETESFAAARLEAWSATHTQTESTLRVGHDSGPAQVTRGWKKTLADAADFFKNTPGGVKMEVQRTNWNIRVSGNVAWATYDQTISMPQFGVKDGHTTEIRCLEKTGGQWTISVLSYTSTYPTGGDDQEAIKKVLREETQAYMDADIAKWSAQHAQDEKQVIIGNNSDGTYSAVIGWAAMAGWAKDDFSKRGKYTDKLSNDNYLFSVQGNMAFVAYDQTLTTADGKASKSREHRVLVRKDGLWKIQAVMVYFNPEGEKK